MMEWYQNKIDGECYNCGHTILTSIVSSDICGDICPRCGKNKSKLTRLSIDIKVNN
jgi:hypothetical protein